MLDGGLTFRQSEQNYQEHGATGSDQHFSGKTNVRTHPSYYSLFCRFETHCNQLRESDKISLLY